MPLRHVALRTVSRFARRFPILRRTSIASVTLTLIWCYVLHWGERTVYSSHVKNCDWDEWEDWPQGATPHRLVFITDPQIVDPHTYPGRPWPLNGLTEMYTDLYMSRNFKLINQYLDPDSIVFGGDLFDGGREWAPSRPRDLLPEQLEYLKELGVIPRKDDEEEGEGGDREGQLMGKRQGTDNSESGDQDSTAKQDTFEDFQEKGSTASESESSGFAQNDIYTAADGTDPRVFVPGENGRWSKWGSDQWELEYDRFGKIFFAPDQLYPSSNRKLVADSRHFRTIPAGVANGAPDTEWIHYSTEGGKQRRLVTSLPGNHDIGFGGRVQLAVRDRFRTYFGDTNRVNVIGNHTFVSLDTPSLSAYNQYIVGGVTSSTQRSKQNYIWKPVSEFLGSMRIPARKAVAETLNRYYPGSHPLKGFHHQVTDNLMDGYSPDDLDLEPPKLPVVLLSHVPFYRNPDMDCGSLREKGHAIAVQAGYQYQNVLTPDLSNLIVKNLAKAKLGDVEFIFSGDDHDYCDVTHRYNVGHYNNLLQKTVTSLKSVREITVKSFSWAMGVRRPGFQLLSLWNPVDQDGHTIGRLSSTIQTQLCILPDQLSIFLSYAFLFVLTVIVLGVRAIVVSLRRVSEWEDEESVGLPLMQQRVTANLSGKTSGYTTPDRVSGLPKGGRQRASSTSTGTAHGSSTNLSVQRSYTARTRSVSPAGFAASNGHGAHETQQGAVPLVEKAGYYPQLRWDDPDDSDEESHLGEEMHDSQAKWKKKRKAASRARRVLNEFCISVVLVGIPCALYYWRLICTG